MAKPVLLREVRDGYQQLVLAVGWDDLVPLILNLDLLRAQLTSCLRITSPRRQVEISLGPPPVSRFEDPEVLEFSERDLDFVLSYLLVYYRDGAADVDHIDITLEHPGGSGELDFTIKVEASKPPLSPAEAKRAIDEIED
jgi:hypothetical protein